ncbi:MAG: PEGA domain-containing protein [Spirochaetales bacterium]|nr:PEGA domain-containing protein [Spirochaetales bacterium]
MKKVIILLLITLLLPGFIFAQRSTGSTSSNFTLTVTANVRGAGVMITGGSINGVLQGSTPFSTSLPKEIYQVTVNAPGYNSQTQNVQLTADQTVNFNLAPANFSLNITSNVPGARIRIQGNGQNINGTANMSVQLPPGTYQIAAVAQGYQAQAQQVVLNNNQTVTFMLMPLTAKATVILGPSILNPRVGNPAAQVKIFDNGQLLRGTEFDLNPGQHTLRVETGGFSFEITLQLEAGKEYRIEPYGGFIVNGQRM